MPRRRRGGMGKFTTSTKNMFSVSESNPMNIQSSLDMVEGVAPNKERVTPNEVPAGAHVFGIDVYVNAIVPSGSGHTNFNYIVQIQRTAQGPITNLDFSSLGLSNLRNQIIHSDMVQLGTEDAGPLRRKLRIKIPRIWRRIRQGDVISLQWVATTTAIEVHMGCRYKYYT